MRATRGVSSVRRGAVMLLLASAAPQARPSQGQASIFDRPSAGSWKEPRMTTTWPGSPQTWWDDVADVPSDRWVPGPEDLPTCRTPEEVGRSYAVVAPLVSRAAMPILAAFVLGAAVPVALTSRIWFDWASVGAVRQTASVLLVVLLALATAYAVAAFVVGEVRLRRARPETLRRVARQLEGEW